MKRPVGTFIVVALLALVTVYFAGTIILGAASSVPGTTIKFLGPIEWRSIPAELLRPTWRQIIEMTPWVLVILFVAIVAATLRSRLSPSLVPRPVVVLALLVGFLPAFLGLCLFSGVWRNSASDDERLMASGWSLRPLSHSLSLTRSCAG